MNSRAPIILDHLASLADTTRSRMLLLLDGHELTVTELCGIVQLPQSTVSRHLKALADFGWVTARAEGTSHLYTMTRDELDAPAGRPRVAPDRRGAARRRDAGARAAPSAGARPRARRDRARRQTRRPRDHRRHAAARARELPAADGARVARLQRRSHAAPHDGIRVRQRADCACTTRPSRKGSGIVCDDRKAPLKRCPTYVGRPFRVADPT